MLDQKVGAHRSIAFLDGQMLQFWAVLRNGFENRLVQRLDGQGAQLLPLAKAHNGVPVVRAIAAFLQVVEAGSQKFKIAFWTHQ